MTVHPCITITTWRWYISTEERTPSIRKKKSAEDSAKNRTSVSNTNLPVGCRAICHFRANALPPPHLPPLHPSPTITLESRVGDPPHPHIPPRLHPPSPTGCPQPTTKPRP